MLAVVLTSGVAPSVTDAVVVLLSEEGGVLLVELLVVKVSGTMVLEDVGLLPGLVLEIGTVALLVVVLVVVLLDPMG